MKKYLVSLLTLMTVATVSLVFASCGDDDDPNFAGEWVGCNSKGEIANEDGSDLVVVQHLLLRQDGTGESCTTRGNEEKVIATVFRYIISFNGKTGTLTAVVTSSPNESLVGMKRIEKFTYENGIIHTTETNHYFKRE